MCLCQHAVGSGKITIWSVKYNRSGVTTKLKYASMSKLLNFGTKKQIFTFIYLQKIYIFYTQHFTLPCSAIFIFKTQQTNFTSSHESCLEQLDFLPLVCYSQSHIKNPVVFMWASFWCVDVDNDLYYSVDSVCIKLYICIPDL